MSDGESSPTERLNIRVTADDLVKLRELRAALAVSESIWSDSALIRHLIRSTYLRVRDQSEADLRRKAKRWAKTAKKARKR